MEDNPRENRDSEKVAAADDLRHLRDALAELHKALIFSERMGYEKVFGTIATPSDFLQLLTRDPWFGWLRQLSEFIVAIDEALDAEEPITATHLAQFVSKTRTLLTPSETGEEFGKHYFDALQNDPDVVMAHSKAVRLLRA